jgi:hypothetical protein
MEAQFSEIKIRKALKTALVTAHQGKATLKEWAKRRPLLELLGGAGLRVVYCLSIKRCLSNRNHFFQDECASE